MVLNKLFRLVPTRVKGAIAATAINAAINAYSIAVTPDSSLTKFVTSLRKEFSLVQQKQSGAGCREIALNN
jgi:hypothetical protein